MKISTIILTSLALLIASTVARAADQQTAFEQANTAFAQKNYGRAASEDQAILTGQGFSAPVLFNLANAYYQDGKLGLAILNYQRAQLLAPRDADIAFNLHLARAKAALADRPTAWFERAARFFSLDTLSWLGAAAVLFIAIGWMAGHFTQRHRFGWGAGITASACVLLATIFSVGLRWSELNQAIVTVKNTPVYISPVTVAQPLYTLAEGQTVILHEAHGDFVLLETSDGHRGWVKRADVSRLIPETHGPQIAST
jgi:tetratricopeptide (TPR) repeat protein